MNKYKWGSKTVPLVTLFNAGWGDSQWHVGLMYICAPQCQQIGWTQHTTCKFQTVFGSFIMKERRMRNEYVIRVGKRPKSRWEPPHPASSLFSSSSYSLACNWFAYVSNEKGKQWLGAIHLMCSGKKMKNISGIACSQARTIQIGVCMVWAISRVITLFSWRYNGIW